MDLVRLILLVVQEKDFLPKEICLCWVFQMALSFVKSIEILFTGELICFN